MVKALMINTNGIVVEVNDMFNNSHFRDMEKDGCSLVVPEIWEHDKYKLSFFIECHSRKHNPVASYIFNHLTSYVKLNENIRGTVWIANENDEGAVDMTKDDLRYITSKIKNIEYASLK